MQVTFFLVIFANEKIKIVENMAKNTSTNMHKLFEHIMQNGSVSEKKSVIDFFSKKDKVYTKKIEMPNNKVTIGECIVKFASLTSVSGKFNDVTEEDIRINMENPYKTWVNIYATDLSEHDIEEIVNSLNI